MAPPPDPGATPRPVPPAPSAGERRTFLVAGGVLFGVLVALIALVALLSGDAGDARPSSTTAPCPPGDTRCQATQRQAERPGIIPRPGEGQAPDEPGDRGGWEQLAVLAVLILALVLIMSLIVRNARRARTLRRRSLPP